MIRSPIACLAFFLVTATSVTQAQGELCDEARVRSILELERSDVACVVHGGRAVMAGVSFVAERDDRLRLATVGPSGEPVRSEVSLSAAHPAHPIALSMIANDLSVDINPLAGDRFRISVYLGNGADYRHVRELAWVGAVDEAGQWHEQYSGYGSDIRNILDNCWLEQRAELRIRGSRVRVLYEHIRRFRAEEGATDTAWRARECQFGRRLRPSSHPLRDRRLPVVVSYDLPDGYPERNFLLLERQLEGEELAVARVLAAATHARFMEDADTYLAHWAPSAGLASSRDPRRIPRNRVRGASLLGPSPARLASSLPIYVSWSIACNRGRPLKRGLSLASSGAGTQRPSK